MRRREFITLVGGAAVAWPLGASAQQPIRIRRIGILTIFAENDPLVQSLRTTLRKSLEELGWQVGRNLQLDDRWSAGNTDQLAAFAKELVELRPDLILTETTLATAAAARETRTVPIIFMLVADPIGSGFVNSLNQPGGNITGFMNMESTMVGKWVELLKEIAPSVKRIALLFHPVTAPYTVNYLDSFKATASALGLEPISAPVQQVSDVQSVVAEQARDQTGGLIVMPDAFLVAHREEILSLTARHLLPAVYPQREFAKTGGLLSYGNDRGDQYPRAANYVDRILKGEKPSNLPVQAPTKYELVINLRTAKALGLTVPPTLLARADEVIE